MAYQTWDDHYKRLVSDKIRNQGCAPQIIQHEEVADNAIVLIHGLTDSSYFMKPIGQEFYRNGFNVVIPLLPGHGLKDPEKKMNSVNLAEWQNEVNFAVDCAKKLGKRVSIGGLSTGGALSVWKASVNPDDITGGLFLFSAALDIGSRFGDVTEKLLRFSPLVSVVDTVQDRVQIGLVGDNPYRYARMDTNGAARLSDLIKEIEDRYRNKPKYSDINQPVFIAHSEADKAADIAELELLFKNHPRKDNIQFFRITKKDNVSHASVILADNLLSSTGGILERKNPVFGEMMRQAVEFAKKNL
ncbi:alpha/beta hydrolase [Limnofasciculus baicalensis]|uniref:Alpha/beta fold hydrolase n=1 Tax=Limnofasciculus baicalensis BBK-W-15 TaxID=2699891 RepID=A0AAE3GVZ3_9CYAN|nr:alpha/beta fold hydrolase [Limnofasciculus baicalensis]MCP2730898.1 alpha/beta fold hydrolase [Limnofasciculus baicalensis BBK-W-15]